MAFSYGLGLIVCSLLLDFGAANRSNEILAENDTKWSPKRLPKPGTFQNCGNKSTEAWLSWTPAKLTFGDTAHINFHVIPPVDLKDGHLKAWGYHDDLENPLYFSECDFTCSGIHLYFKFLCPFTKGKAVNVKNYKWYIKPSTQLVTGDYYVRVKLFAKSGQELLCIFGHIVMLDD